MADTTHTSYPNLNGNGINSSPNGSAAGLKDSIANRPMAQKAKEEANITSTQFSNVANSRRIPDQQTATGQSLTHYHSMFYNILSWENPRVTGIAYASIVAFIFFTRYVPILKYFFKASYTILGIIAAAEIAGKLVFEKGLATQVRPRKYYTLPRESLEAALEDFEQFINFFVIEFQRIVFAENVYATVSAFTAALISYFLVKFVPKWGIALIATSAVFFLPLIYIQNRELIDGQLDNASTMINQQASQVRDLAAQHTGRAGEIAKSTVSQYSAKASELMGQAKDRAASITGQTSPQTTSPPTTSEPTFGAVKKEDFPAAPTATPATIHTAEPVGHGHEEASPQLIPAL
ncbi:hypothetical protein ANO11243_078650 [Dothideomycetidae sp. 11243]|nr:hypothetical protein ANO11243_078650 [fungal sp. No.11243]